MSEIERLKSVLDAICGTLPPCEGANSQQTGKDVYADCLPAATARDTDSAVSFDDFLSPRSSPRRGKAAFGRDSESAAEQQGHEREEEASRLDSVGDEPPKVINESERSMTETETAEIKYKVLSKIADFVTQNNLFINLLAALRLHEYNRIEPTFANRSLRSMLLFCRHCRTNQASLQSSTHAVNHMLSVRDKLSERLAVDIFILGSGAGGWEGNAKRIAIENDVAPGTYFGRNESDDREAENNPTFEKALFTKMVGFLERNRLSDALLAMIVERSTLACHSSPPLSNEDMPTLPAEWKFLPGNSRRERNGALTRLTSRESKRLIRENIRSMFRFLHAKHKRIMRLNPPLIHQSPDPSVSPPADLPKSPFDQLTKFNVSERPPPALAWSPDRSNAELKRNIVQLERGKAELDEVIGHVEGWILYLDRLSQDVSMGEEARETLREQAREDRRRLRSTKQLRREWEAEYRLTKEALAGNLSYEVLRENILVELERLTIARDDEVGER